MAHINTNITRPVRPIRRHEDSTMETLAQEIQLHILFTLKLLQSVMIILKHTTPTFPTILHRNQNLYDAVKIRFSASVIRILEFKNLHIIARFKFSTNWFCWSSPANFSLASEHNIFGRVGQPWEVAELRTKSLVLFDQSKCYLTKSLIILRTGRRINLTTSE